MGSWKRSPGWVCQAVVLRDGWWGADGHMWCFDSFFQEDYIPYPSIDEVGALNHPEHLSANFSLSKIADNGELGGLLFQRGAARSTSSLPAVALAAFLG